MPRWRCWAFATVKASVEFVRVIGIDLARRVFQLDGSGTDGAVASYSKLCREKLLESLAFLPTCVVARDAWANVHYLGPGDQAACSCDPAGGTAYVNPFAN